MFCEKCGAEINDEAVVCVKCGCMVRNINQKNTAKQEIANEAVKQNKYCTKCGVEIRDDAVICTSCGCLVPEAKQKKLTASSESGFKKAAKILMIISCIIMGFYIITLAWTIPMTIKYCNKLKNNEPISSGFKVCILLFVNTIAGILLLCEKD